MGALRPSRRDILDISLVIGATDLAYGMVAPTFSLYVESIGGSVLLVGVLAGVVAAVRLLGAIPIGRVSDARGPKVVIVCGLWSFAAAALLFTATSNPLLLIGPRIIFAVGMLATFPLGIAYLGDFVRPERRTLAIAIYVSAQGLGYTLGPFLGAALAERTSYVATYRTAAGVAVAAALAAAVRLRARPGGPQRERSRERVPPSAGLAGASLANAAMLLMFSGTVVPLLSLYVTGLGASTLAVGVVYAVRSAASMLSRVPAGLVGTRASNGGLIVAALAIDAVAALGIGATSSLAVVGAAAALDGVAFGVFLASSQSVVADVSTAATRGAALGIYGTAGAAGEIVGAFGLGTVAEVTSARVAFVAAGCALAVCLPAVAALLARATPMAGAQLPSSG